jgi:polysaccharide biosynthesis transport protein
MGELKPPTEPGTPLTNDWRNWMAASSAVGPGSGAGFEWLWLLLPALRRWSLISMLAGLGLLLGLLSAYLIGRTYEASAQLEIETIERRVVRVDSVTSGVSGDKAIIDGQIELMQSASLARYLIRTLGLYGVEKQFVPTTASDPQLGIPDDLVDTFLSSLVVERVGGTYLVNINFRDSDPKVAAQVANAIGRTYMQRKQEARLSATREANHWLQSQIDVMRQKVQVAEQKALQYRMDHDLIQVGTQNLNEVELGQQVANLITARANVLKLSARVKQVDQIGNDPAALRALSFVADSKQIADMEQTAAELRGKEADLRVRFGANHPDVDNAMEQLKSLQQRINEEIQQVVAGLRQTLAVATQEVALLEGEFDTLKGQLTRKNLETLELGELERDRESTKALYINFLTRLKETQAQETLPGENAIVVSEAYAPSRPLSSRRMIIVAASTLAGLLLGYLASLFADLRQAGFIRYWLSAFRSTLTPPESKDRSGTQKAAKARQVEPVS